MSNTALQRITQAALLNKSGGAVVKGDVVIVDSANAGAFTTTTTAGFVNGLVGVVIEPNGIASNATGMIQFSGPCPQVNLSGSASLGDLFRTHSVAKQAVRHAVGIQAGDFGIVLGTGTTPACILWGLPAGATGAGTGNFSGPGSSVAGDLVSFADTTGLLAADSGLAAASGWISAEAWTYVSADGPTGVFSAASDVTGKYQPGMRIKLTQTTAKYFIITAVGAFAAGVTPITVYGGTDYVLANAAITLPFYSWAKAPFGMNISPAKWTETFTDATNRTQASPVAATWYNVGSLQLSIPIGVWLVEYMANLRSNKAAATVLDADVTLSTANNSETDLSMSAYFVTGGASGALVLEAKAHMSRYLTLAAKTTYFLNMMSSSSAANVGINGASDSTTIIRAICALL